LFSEHCAECHVPGGVDTKGPRLDHPQFLALASDAYILRSIRVGRPGTPMKAWESVLRRDQVRDLVAAIRSRDTEARHRETGHHHAERERAPSHDLGPDPIVTLWESVSDETLAVGEATARGPAFDLEGRWYVSARQLRAALSAGRRMILLDARPMSDWLTGHLPGALPVPFYADPETIERIPTDGTQVVIYCGCPHAAADRVAHRLKDRGVTNVAVLNEGFWHWKDNGYPVVTGESRY
jgi:rhodanese-related sulfurtransferase